MQDYVWMEFQLFIFGLWLLKCFIQINQRKSKIKYDETHRVTNKYSQNQTKIPTHQDHLELSNVDYVSLSAKSSQFDAILYIFEDNEASIKMIIKDRSPTMRHVSMTHRITLDWLFDRIIVDLKIHKSNVLTPIINSQTDRQKTTSHVMSGQIFSICSVAAFSAQQAVPKWRRKECIWQQGKEMWQSRSRR